MSCDCGNHDLQHINRGQQQADLMAYNTKVGKENFWSSIGFYKLKILGSVYKVLRFTKADVQAEKGLQWMTDEEKWKISKRVALHCI